MILRTGIINNKPIITHYHLPAKVLTAFKTLIESFAVILLFFPEAILFAFIYSVYILLSLII